MTAITVDAAVKPRRSFQEVWVISLGHALTHWYPATFYLLLPLIGKELGLSYGEIGSVLSCQYLAGAIVNIPGGIFVDTVGRKGLLMAASLFWIGFPYLIMGFSHSYWMILACATLVGIGNNLWHPSAIPWLANRFPQRKGLVMSIHGMGGNVGDAVAPLVVGALLAVLNWRNVVVINVLPGVLLATFTLIYLGRKTSDDDTGIDDGDSGISGLERLRMFGALLKNRALITLAAGSAFRTMTQGALLTFLPIYLGREMGYPTQWIGACMFALQAGGFIAAPIAGHLSDRIGRRQIIVSSMAMSAVVIFLMLFAGGTGWFVMFVSVLGFFLFAVRAVLQAWLLDATPPAMGGSAIGLLFASQAFGQAVGPVSAGIVADHYGLMGAFYFLATTIVIANLLVFVTPAGLMKRD
ncbi:MAG TPA: MFS transporter [Xanthobacteraceae bacterium]|jgi:FSR family fosmidomycin resistance protein-like MFS transporter|nr:MFS transporter [Xanthobacteraceae bacterium]